MKVVSALLTVFLIALTVGAQTSQANVAGNWLGTLELGASKLRLVLKISKSANGYSAKLDSLDQGATDLMIDSIVLDGSKLTFSGAQLGLSYEGTLKETSDEITGTFKQVLSDDVLAGIAFLKQRQEIDPKMIGLIGHSEGGIIAPLVAARSSDVAFIVLLADLGQRDASLGDLQKKLFEPVTANVKAMMAAYKSRWYRYFMTFDPAPILRRVKVPVLALNGELDMRCDGQVFSETEPFVPNQPDGCAFRVRED